MRGGAIWRVPDDGGVELREVPAEECARCGCIRPDVRKIDAMDPGEVPSSVRKRCAEIRFVNWRLSSGRQGVRPRAKRLTPTRPQPCR